MNNLDDMSFKILFYPELPSEHSTIYKIAKALSYEIINDPQRQYDLAIYWEDTTFKKACSLPQSNSKIINEYCIDISKKKINEVFVDVFGYSTLIEPTSFNGKCVKKNNLNAKHDG